jgi:catalase (peroxidase I)
MAWHSSGTYNEKEGTGGSNGATMRFAPEKDDPENNGLGYARELLAKVHQDFPQLSLADIYVLAGCVALEVTGGPEVAFTPGRTDAPEGSVGCPHGLLPMAEFHLKGPPGEDGRIPGWEKLAAHIRDIFGRMGFTDREMVALISGGHTYGRCHPEHSGYAGVWIENPLEFSNEYCADMFEDEWIAVTHDTVMPDGGSVPDEVRPAEGKWQYINLSKYEALAEEPEAVQQMMLVSDMVLLWDEAFKEPLKEYAEDPELMKTEFGVAFKKLTELGCPFAKKS